MDKRGPIAFDCWDEPDDERVGEVRNLLRQEGWTITAAQSARARVLMCVGTASVPIEALSSTGPTIVITVRADPVRYIEAGADDALAFPVRARELSARLHALVRRSTHRVVTAGPITVDLAGRQVTMEGRRLAFTKTELETLCYLAQHTDRPVAADELRKHVTGTQYADGSWARVHIHGIRSKLGDAAWIVETARGYGYRLAGAEPYRRTPDSP